MTTTGPTASKQRAMASSELAPPRGPERSGPRMSRETNMTTPGPGAFVRPLTIDDDAIGGKARSLARLAGLGLPIPPGFAVGAALFHRLRAGGPPLPTRLVSAADLARLDAARRRWRRPRFPKASRRSLAPRSMRSVSSMGSPRARLSKGPEIPCFPPAHSPCDRRSPTRTAPERWVPGSTHRSCGCLGARLRRPSGASSRRA